MKPSQVARRREQHICIFGDPATGKSTLVAKLLLNPSYKLTWISMDNGHEVIFKLGIPLEVLDERLNLIILPDTKDNPVAVKTCLRIISGAEVSICDAHGEVNCPKCQSQKEKATWSKVCLNNFAPNEIIVFDHLGQLANSAMSAAYIRAKKPEDEKPEWDQYGSQGIILDKFLTNVQQSKANIICITHVGEVVMEDDTKKLVPLCGTTNFSRNTGKFFDHMIYCHMHNGSHRFGSMTTYKNNVVAKSRTDIAIEKMKEPSLVPYFDGTILPPEDSDSKDAAKVLSSLSQKISKVSEEPAAKVESQQTEKETVATEIETPNLSAQSTAVTTVSTPQKPTQDRAALLAKLALMNKGNR